MHDTGIYTKKKKDVNKQHNKNKKKKKNFTFDKMLLTCSFLPCVLSRYEYLMHRVCEEKKIMNRRDKS